jgi:EAL domain-containing protein (putative c-di-GMP-specific phosphodiesterase class I)
LELTNAVRIALLQDGLTLYFQPMLDCVSGTVVAADVLLRWRDPRGPVDGPVVPLETQALVVPLGQWTLLNACRQGQAWRTGGAHDELRVAIHVSGPQLHHPSFPRMVQQALSVTGLPPELLEVQIPEAVATARCEAVVARMAELRKLGVRLCITCFGTEDLVLGQLSRYPVDVLKIDPSVIRDIGSNRHQEAVATAAIALARSLNLRVVADGVVEEAQRELLARWGCDAIQGALCGAPMPPAEFGELLDRQESVVTALAGDGSAQEALAIEESGDELHGSGGVDS